MRKIIRLRYLLYISAIALFSSCADKDLYDESNNVAETAELFGDSISVSDDFDWSTTKTINLTVSVNDQYNGQYYYKVSVYDANPLFDESANLLGAGVAKSGQNFVSDVVVPSGTNVLYAKQTDPTGAESVAAVELTTDSVATITFSATSTTKSSLLKSTSSSVSMPSISIPDTPTSGYTDMTNSSFTGTVHNGGNYVIPSGKTYSGTVSCDWTTGGTIYVDGTWEIPSSFSVIYYNVVVHGNGKIKFTNSGLTFTPRGNLIVASGGEISGNPSISLEDYRSISLYIANYGTINANVIGIYSGSTLYNYGTINATELKGANTSSYDTYNSGTLNLTTINLTGGGTFYNFNTVVATTINTQNSSNCTIYNEGSVETTDLTFTGSGGTLTNNCHLEASNEISLAGATVNVAGGGLISTKTLDLANTTINLASSAMLVATTTNFENSGTTYVYGGTSNTSKAYFKTPTINYSSYNNTIFIPSGNLVVYATTYTNATSTYNVPVNGATFTKDLTATPSVSSSTCNDGGNNVSSSTPTDQTTTSVALGTYSYAFEDQWPSYGDYDMNDFVTDITLTRMQNTDNLTTELIIKAEIRAVGAENRLAAAIQLDDIKASTVKSVTYSNTNIVGTNLPLSSTGVESGQTYAVMPICDDAHAAFGLSTPAFINTTSYLTLDSISVTITIEFNEPQKLFTNDDLNVFIITAGYSGTKRTEIHLNERPATDKANTALFSSANLKSSDDPYKSHENLIWGICVPGSFNYPSEYEKITTKYKYFTSWAKSGGTSHTTWYDED